MSYDSCHLGREETQIPSMLLDQLLHASCRRNWTQSHSALRLGARPASASPPPGPAPSGDRVATIFIPLRMEIVNCHEYARRFENALPVPGFRGVVAQPRSGLEPRTGAIVDAICKASWLHGHQFNWKILKDIKN